MDKYNYIIELSRDLPVIDPKLKVNGNLINGCQSKVWLDADYDGWRSDRIPPTVMPSSPKALFPCLSAYFRTARPDEILDTDLYFIDRIGLRQNLSPTRSNGLLSMIKQMKLYALAYQNQIRFRKPGRE